MIPLIQYGLGIRNDKVMIRYVDTERGKQKERIVKSVDDFKNFIITRMKLAKCEPEDLIIMCSSSMDFPEDSTNNKKTIKLARELR